MTGALAVLAAVALLAILASIAFGRLSGKSAVTAMEVSLLAVFCLALVVFLALTFLTRRIV